MRIVSYDEAEALDKQLWRIDVVVFNLYGTDIDGEYAEMDGGPHPFECFFDDLREAEEYAATFDRNMAEDTLVMCSNDGYWDNVAVEVNELNGMDPGYVVASHDWMHGCEHHYWHYEGNVWTEA